MKNRSILFVLILVVTGCKDTIQSKRPIDRFELVTRHNIELHEVDTLGSLSVGNGEFAFTVDISGLQTFFREYENGIPLGTQSQWGWHKTPDPESHSIKDVLVKFKSCDNKNVLYPVQHTEGKAGKATDVLRANPHRLHLGLIGLTLLKSNGDLVKLADLKKINQTLDLWTGKITSTYEIEGVPVKVVLYGHQLKDQIAVNIQSNLIAQKRLRVEFNFPYAKECHVCPGYDFQNPGKHFSTLSQKTTYSTIKHELDSTTYFVNLTHSNGTIKEIAPHKFELTPTHDNLSMSVLFSTTEHVNIDSFEDTQQNSIDSWKEFWSSGGAIDFSECTNELAPELERRIILSQYLTKIQCSGSLPPQETGLTMNSWYGKFHMEMYWWHGAHFALWNRNELLEKSMSWYYSALTKAKATANAQGYKGARWQKMTSPDGDESPSDIGAFIIWQQPHPIYLAELLFRSRPSKATLDKYAQIVETTADFMVSFLKKQNGKYHLCHPLIPAQEIFKATDTDDPAFELQYWHYALTVAQEWRIRQGLDKNPFWEEVLNNIAPLPVNERYYLPVANSPNAYTDDQYRRDHPAVLGAFGFLPGSSRIDPAMMRNTLKEILAQWDWESTWGWDFPLMAMTATRLHQPRLAIEALLMDTPKNTFLVNGHNYQDKRLRLYLPGNGALLAAVALMTAGWEGNSTPNPGFPDDGTWKIKWDGIQKMP
jgi:protein-glucosylgalactosylhydroxylysine glucosidase